MALLASLRSTIAYQTTGSTISTGAIYTTLAGNVPAWTNQLTYSTLTGSTISTNSIAAASTLTGSSIILSGNMGIGTASPSQILEVYRNSGVGTVTQMNITSWAGVATTTNQSILNLRIQGAGGGSVDNIIIGQYYSSGTGTYGISFNPNNGVNVMNILGSGRVGIGTIDPVTTLHVSGASSTYTNGQLFISDANYPGNQLRLFSYWGIQISTSFATIQSMYDTTPNRLAINPNGGNVGIGTTNPAMPLSIGQYGGMLGGSTFTSAASVNGVSTGLTIPAGTMYLISCATVAGSGVSNQQWYNTSLVQYGSGNTSGFVTAISSSNIVILCSSAGVITVNILSGTGSYTLTINAIRLC